ncbi:MAG TPA: CBS domain-containing protein [Candidatus Nitrosotenuis sp.]|jgi:CBS domain-containing protein|nr:CBS domain-containing protein [Candidatus Nitrosotenuis sp.]
MSKTQPTILVKDIMTKSLVTVDASSTVNEAAKLMEKAQVGSVIVMEKNVPIGIMTDRDFAIKIAAHAYPIHTKVKQVMSSPLIHISPNDEAWSAADLMYARKIRRLPVLDEDELLGIVTATDFVKLYTVCNREDTRRMYYRALTKIFDDHNEEAVAAY